MGLNLFKMTINYVRVFIITMMWGGEEGKCVCVWGGGGNGRIEVERNLGKKRRKVTRHRCNILYELSFQRS